MTEPIGPMVDDSEALILIAAATEGTPGACTADEVAALIGWAEQTRLREATLEMLLRGEE